ncbi:hypothetical protein AB6A40_003908 [Gnathostoma spinigerum]|uniref:Uncharacterized protein n=1 Tax=Gnathostoma spinigerum TaxID=75299 RepID=A0ABD6EGE0_9BILA
MRRSNHRFYDGSAHKKVKKESELPYSQYFVYTPSAPCKFSQAEYPIDSDGCHSVFFDEGLNGKSNAKIVRKKE